METGRRGLRRPRKTLRRVRLIDMEEVLQVLEVDRRHLDEDGDAADEAPGFHIALAQAEGARADGSGRRRNAYSGTWAYRAAKTGETPSGSLLERALGHLRLCASELDETSPEPADFLADPRIVTARGGERIVHLQQHVHGVPVFRAVRSVRFDSQGEIIDVVGDQVPLGREEVDLLPTLRADEAVLAAARHLAAPGGDQTLGIPGLKVSNRRARTATVLSLPASPTLVRKPPFPGLIATHLVLFYERPRLVLGWYVPLALDEPLLQYDLIVAANGADAGEILFCRSGVVSAGSFTAIATRFNPLDEPLASLAMPQPAGAYPPLPTPPGFPMPWVDGGASDGNNVVATRRGAVVRATPQGTTSQLGGAANSDEEKVANAFFLCNYLHDFFLLLGFDEASGNFQKRNSSATGGANDAVEVRIFGAPFSGDARFLIRRDGDSVRLDLGPVPQGRHTALDAEVLIHEYTHGVTSRLIGARGEWKPLINGPFQARAMDEGTSDFFALTIQNHLRRRGGLAETLVYGAWASGKPATGFRPFSYAGFTHPFDSLASGTFNQPHAGGMIWCAALLEMNRRLGAQLGSAESGDVTGWLLLIEALRKMPIGQAAPSFLDGRDALLRAVGTLGALPPRRSDGSLLFALADLPGLETSVRAAFASLGMGRGARSRDGTRTGLFNDFNP